MTTVRILSSNGQDYYEVPVNDKGQAGPCPCKAGQNDRKCRHISLAEEQCKPKERGAK